jgi:PhnB protein
VETSTITAYPVVQDVPALVTFLSRAFRATEKFRGKGASGGYHVELQIGRSSLMIGGGTDPAWKGTARPMAFHIYVADADASYSSAMANGAESLVPPTDLGHGRRTANIKDPSGNRWYIASAGRNDKVSFDPPLINPIIHSLNPPSYVAFLRKLLGVVDFPAADDGSIFFIGKSGLEIAPARGIYQPMPGMFHVCLADANAVAAVAASNGIAGFGGNRFGFTDAWQNTWYLYTHPAQ